MARITVEELLERKVSEFKDAESEKKKELNEIQVELRSVKFHIKLTHNSQIKLPYFSHSLNEVI